MTQDVTTPVQIEAGRAERDGCGCPPWVVQCAHFDGRWVVVHLAWVGLPLYVVCEGTGLVDTGDSYWHEDSDVLLDEADHDAALEAFHAAEERLIAGEPS